MLVSHESPIEILDQSRLYNDYDYALVHLFENHPEYYKFFERSLAHGREVLLNSIFELGKAFDPKKFSDYIKKLKPTYYVVPDVLEDCDATCSSFSKFNLNYNSNNELPGLQIGVIQGKTYEELVRCYDFMSQKADYIAISFDYSWYQTIGLSTSTNPKTSKLQKYANGRLRLIDQLIRDGIWNYDKPHHLLGCSLAYEFSYYRGMKSIRSLDTSNPVVAGLHNDRYLKGIGLTDKRSVMLADLVDSEVNQDQLEDILYNVKEFKNLIR